MHCLPLWPHAPLPHPSALPDQTTKPSPLQCHNSVPAVQGHCRPADNNTGALQSALLKPARFYHLTAGRPSSRTVTRTVLSCTSSGRIRQVWRPSPVGATRLAASTGGPAATATCTNSAQRNHGTVLRVGNQHSPPGPAPHPSHSQ